MVDRYQLVARLGSGGMGEVFLGRSPGGRAVAVKLVRRELADDYQFRKRFAKEVDAARRVGGFHTAQVVDADPAADPPWLVTAYVPGPSLAAAIAEHGPLPQGSLWVLGAGLVEALEAIHRAGLVHRDLKPSNILLADDGPRVIDFGIARALDATPLTRAGATIGTPGFMAPEQVTGSRPVSPATDVFAFGSVLCHAAGALPFGEGPPTALLYRVVHQEPDLTGFSGDLYDVVVACLDKDPARRPTPSELLDRLGDGTAPGQWLPAPVVTMLLDHAPPDTPRPVPSAPQQGPGDITGQRLRAQATPLADVGGGVVFHGGKGIASDIAVELSLLLILLLFIVVLCTPSLHHFLPDVFVHTPNYVTSSGDIKPRPIWYYSALPALYSLGILWKLTRPVRIRLARCDLRIGPDGIEQGRVGGPPIRYHWNQITRIALDRIGDSGDFAIRVLPAPGTSPPPRPPKFHPYPMLAPNSAWVLIGSTQLYHAKPETIEAAFVRYAGPKWEPPS